LIPFLTERDGLTFLSYDLGAPLSGNRLLNGELLSIVGLALICLLLQRIIVFQQIVVFLGLGGENILGGVTANSLTDMGCVSM
jgi:hypothetical protein